MTNKEQFNLTRTLQTQYLADIDMSGSLFLEYENNKYNFKNRERKNTKT